MRSSLTFHPVRSPRRMEVIGSRPTTKWIRFHGIPLQAWNEGVFHLLDDFIGSTIEVDRRISEKMIVAYGRVKVLTSRLCKLPLEVPLFVHELLISVKAEDLPILIASTTDRTSPLATSVAPIEDGDLRLIGGALLKPRLRKSPETS